MYWNNPIIRVTYPLDSQSDPIKQSFHNGSHCIFYNTSVPKETIHYQQSLKDICDWANKHIESVGVDGLITNPKNHYDIANLVKLNMWIQDIRKQGIVKPWLIQDPGDGSFRTGNGESRLRCLERIPEIQTVSAFISAHSSRAYLYSDLEPVDTFEHFAQLCNAEYGQQFLFRLTNANAPYGLDWYEYNSSRTQSVTPGQDEAVSMMASYFSAHSGIKITPEWFDQSIDWLQYQACL